LTLRTNAQFLMKLFNMTDTEVGIITPPDLPARIELSCYLGRGVTSTVFSATQGNARCALKSFTGPEAQTRRDSENATLLALATVPRVPRARGTPLATLLLMEPVLEHFSSKQGLRQPLSQKHIQDLFETIRQVHAAGFVHRDIRRDNILKMAGAPGDAHLIDFGFAIKLADGDKPYEGAVSTASQRVLEFMRDRAAKTTRFDFTPADDLVSLVKVRDQFFI